MMIGQGSIMDALRGFGNSSEMITNGQSTVDPQTQQEIIAEKLKQLRQSRSAMSMPEGAQVGQGYSAPKVGAYALAGLGVHFPGVLLDHILDEVNVLELE